MRKANGDVSVRDSQSMINACRAANRKLMIAYRCQYESTNLRAIQLIREGKLGTIQAIESANGFVEKAGEWRLNRKLAGGGPLMDIGVYSLNACRYLTGEEPAHLEASCSVIDKDGRFAEVEENVGWVMRFPSGIVATCNTSYGANMPGFVRVHGSKGVLHLEPAFLLSRHPLHRQYPGRSAYRRNESRQGPRAIRERSRSFRRLHFRKQRAEEQR